MLEIDRFEMILKQLNIHERISYTKLESLIDSSPSTIRRDVNKMHGKGLLVKIKGGIALKSKLNFDMKVSDRFKENVEEKREICEIASKLLKKNDFIYLDASTTCFYLIAHMANMDITVITNGLMHIDELIQNNIKTIIVGGEVKDSTKAIIGVEAIQSIEHYRFDKCFIGTNGVDLSAGYTTPESNEALLKRKVISLSQEKYIMADTSKFDITSNICFSNLEDCKIITNDKTDLNKKYSKYLI